ncbi:MerR family transcriptional regulator [Nocardioides jensenii]|uniref:MerR family transcriptional regulator n=1 Tax=Nocardioides jensenii TaxID=1843 RepID=UPI000831A430|nr:MerR family transcriptional regulator [Nocardioides jensenii]
MRISKLSERAGLPVGTVKFYLRSGLLHSGRATSATQALYDETHLDRLRLIRALLEVGRLSLAEIHEILDAAHLPGTDTETRVARVQQAIATSAAGAHEPTDVAQAQALVTGFGWQVATESPNLSALARALRAADSVGFTIDDDHLQAYADAAARLAHRDREALDAAPADQLPTVAASSVLLDQVLIALHRLAAETRTTVTSTRGALPKPRRPVPVR